MNENLRYKVLKILRYNGNILDLSTDGYQYSQIAEFIKELRKNDYLVSENYRYLLSPKGSEFIAEYERNNHIKQESKALLPNISMWKKPMSKFDIYISR